MYQLLEDLRGKWYCQVGIARDENFVSMHLCFLVNPIDDCELSSFDEATCV
jgi:hypothetical protein